jgi:YtfJ family uncharacterized protein
MSTTRMIFGILLLIASGAALAEVPTVQSPLPPLSITDRGELKLEDNEFSYTPWGSAQNPGKVHIVQYFGGTKSDSEIFKPFTDLLQETFNLGTYHVTTIINLDAALWGTSGFVVSEVKEKKRKFPLSTMVLDEDGAGVSVWQLGEQGAGLVILDSQGIVRYFTTGTMSAEEMRVSVDLVRSNMDS